MVTFDLGTTLSTEVNQYPYGELRGTEVPEDLVVLFLRQLRDSLALHDDVIYRRLNDQIHLEIGFERFAISIRSGFCGRISVTSSIFMVLSFL